MKPIRVPGLAPEQLADLEDLYRTTREARPRTRAQMGLKGCATRRIRAMWPGNSNAHEDDEVEVLLRGAAGRLALL